MGKIGIEYMKAKAEHETIFMLVKMKKHIMKSIRVNVLYRYSQPFGQVEFTTEFE